MSYLINTILVNIIYPDYHILLIMSYLIITIPSIQEVSQNIQYLLLHTADLHKMLNIWIIKSYFLLFLSGDFKYIIVIDSGSLYTLCDQITKYFTFLIFHAKIVQ